MRERRLRAMSGVKTANFMRSRPATRIAEATVASRPVAPALRVPHIARRFIVQDSDLTDRRRFPYRAI